LVTSTDVYNILLDAVQLPSAVKVRSCNNDSCHLMLGTRISAFSCSSKALWDDLTDQSQQSSRLWLVKSTHVSSNYGIMPRLSAV